MCEDFSHAGVQRWRIGVRQCLHQHTLQAGLDGNHIELAGRTVDLLHDGRRQRNAHATRQLHRVGRLRGVFGQRLDDGADITNVHRVLQQQLEHFLERCDGHHFRDDFFDEFGGQLGHMVNELLRLGTRQQLGRVHLHQV